MRDKRRERIGTAVRMGVALAIAVATVGGCMWYIAENQREKETAVSEVRQVAEQVAPAPEPREAFDEHLLRRIDFASLQSVNPDATRWMSVPGTDIDSYVLQEQKVGRYRYDLRNIYGRYNGAGSFLVPAATRDEDGNLPDDAHTLILGHRMNSYNGEWQFSELPTRWASADGARSHPYVYLYHEDRAERWRVWAGMDAWASDRIYDIPYGVGEEDYGEMLEHVRGSARYLIGDAPDADTRTLFLSTCNRPNGGALMRFALVLVPDATYFYDTGEYVDMSDARAEARWMKAHAEAEAENVEAHEEALRAEEMTPLNSVDEDVADGGGEHDTEGGER